MKKTVAIVISTLFMLACGGNPETKTESKGNPDSSAKELKKTDKTLKRYEVKSGIIEYQTSTTGNVMGFKITGRGTKKLIFKNFGTKEIIEEEKTENNMGETTHTHSLTKFDNGVIYTVDFDRKTIVKGDESGVYKSLAGKNSSLLETGEEMMKAMGGKKTGKGEVLSYTCDIWEIMGQKIWIYKGVTLKTEGDMLGIKVFEKAVKIDFNIDIADSYFNLPDFPVQEITDTNPEINTGEGAKENLQKIKNMSFEEFKEMAKEDEELRSMTEKDLRNTYEMMKKMANMMPGK